jgi:hypothetical protein
MGLLEKARPSHSKSALGGIRRTKQSILQAMRLKRLSLQSVMSGRKLAVIESCSANWLSSSEKRVRPRRSRT